LAKLTSWELFLLELDKIDSEAELLAMLQVPRPVSYQQRIYSRFSRFRKEREVLELKRYVKK
jgi:hypothetical protein